MFSLDYARSRPVVRVKSKLSFSTAINKQVNLDEKGCTLRDLTPVTCLPLSLCLEYDGVGADDVIGKRGFKISVANNDPLMILAWHHYLK